MNDLRSPISLSATAHGQPAPPLRCACLVDLRNNQLLLVRVRENEHWYLPGGKIEAHESAEAALQRELLEELGVELAPESIRYLYSVVGPAYGQACEVELVCFSARWGGEPRALGEISEVRWLDCRDPGKFAPAVQMLCARYLRDAIRLGQPSLDRESHPGTKCVES